MSERHVAAQAPVACAIEVARELLIDDPSGVFAPRTHPDVERRTFPTTLRMKSASGVTTMQQVTVALGIPETPGGNRFPISWSPTAHRRALPSFRGHLDLDPDGDLACVVRVKGAYVPPFGAAGALVDAVAMHRYAERSVEDLVTFTAIRLAECAAAREESVSWHPAPAPEPLRDRLAPDAWLG
jgi:hypothetical protein